MDGESPGGREAFILFGATGSLARNRIFPALSALKGKKKLDPNLKIVGYGRKNLNIKPFENFFYLKGDLKNAKVLSDFIESEDIRTAFCYIALPPGLYVDVVRFIKRVFGEKMPKVALEKPFGTSLENARILAKLVKEYGKENFHLVDHYLVKEPVVDPRKFASHFKNMEDIKSLEVFILEKGDVSKRGSLYDELGAIKDTGQNHLLNTAASLLSHESKDKFFEKLRYKKGSLLLGQYEEYLKTGGIKEDSKIETYFRADFDYDGICVILRSGKAIKENKNFVNIVHKDGRSACIEIRSISREGVTPHEYIIDDFVNDKSKFSLTLDEAISAWKITEEILKDRKRTILRIYPRNSSYKEIEGVVYQ